MLSSKNAYYKTVGDIYKVSNEKQNKVEKKMELNYSSKEYKNSSDPRVWGLFF